MVILRHVATVKNTRCQTWRPGASHFSF